MSLSETKDSATVELRPGVFRPDFSAAQSPAAREVLSARGAFRPSLIEHWAVTLEEQEDLVWRGLLALFASHGHPPSLIEIASETNISPDRVSTILANLRKRDLVGLDADGQAVVHAYPFTSRHTGHTVELGEHVLNSLCAIDALGTGEMYDTDVLVRSKCMSCQMGIEVATGDRGRTVRRVLPASAAVWYDLGYSGTAASSCCPKIAFFCSDQHLTNWQIKTRSGEGRRLTIMEALEVGRAIFGPVLCLTKQSH